MRECGLGCRGKDCFDAVTTVSRPDIQQNNLVELLEVEQEELLQADALRREYGEEWVTQEEEEDEQYSGYEVDVHWGLSYD